MVRDAHGKEGRATAKLIYMAISSLDGYVEDAEGKFDWSAPDDEVHGFVNDLERSVGTHLYGRRMYETMAYWENPPDFADQASVYRDYAEIWQAAEKVVYSKTLRTPSSARTRIEQEFDPEAVRRLKAAAARDLSVGGAELAAQAIATGLVDEFQLFLVPVIVGGGKRSLPDNVRVNLQLLGQRGFHNGTVYLHYAIRPGRLETPRHELLPKSTGPTRSNCERAELQNNGESSGVIPEH